MAEAHVSGSADKVLFTPGPLTTSRTVKQAMLRDAVARGWKDAAQMKKDTDLDALRPREDFQQLLKELERK